MKNMSGITDYAQSQTENKEQNLLILFCFCLQDVQDPSVIVSFPLVESENVSLIAWTTTPWTLPSNLALCVNPEFLYVQVKGEKLC